MLLQIEQHGVACPVIGVVQGLQILLGGAAAQDAHRLLPSQGVLLRDALGFAAARLYGIVSAFQPQFILVIGKGTEQIQALFPQGGGGSCLDAPLLNAHVHHVAHQVGQAQIAGGLTKEQNQTQKQYRPKGLQIARHQFHRLAPFPVSWTVCNLSRFSVIFPTME